MLKEAAYPEAALPLARLLADPENEIQYEAIGAELNIFLAEKIVPRRRVALVVEVRNKMAAEAAFTAGPLALGSHPVPSDVLGALLAAARDENPAVALEALYGFGTLAAEPAGTARREVLRTSAPALAPMLGSPNPSLRRGALRVVGRVFAWRAQDGAVDESLGDAVIIALNDSDRNVHDAAEVEAGEGEETVPAACPHCCRGAEKRRAADKASFVNARHPSNASYRLRA